MPETRNPRLPVRDSEAVLSHQLCQNGLGAAEDIPVFAHADEPRSLHGIRPVLRNLLGQQPQKVERSDGAIAIFRRKPHCVS